jgi:hypothetical protein
LTGTCAQLVAIGIVIYELLTNPDPDAKTELVRNSGHYERQFVALFNMVFAFGGQFAFTGDPGCAVLCCAVLGVWLVWRVVAAARCWRDPQPVLLPWLLPPHPSTTELMTDMRVPQQFVRAISVCTVIMTTL